MADIRKVNRHVKLRLADGRIKPGTITAVGGGTACDVRVGHGGGTYAAVSRYTTPGTIGWKKGRGVA